MPVRNTNDWNLDNLDEPYVDFSKELIDFKDEGNSSVDMKLTFNTETHTAHICLAKHNDDGDISILGDEINVTWEEALRLLGDTPLPKEITR